MFLKNDRFQKRSLFVFFIVQNLKTIEKRIEKRSFNDRFQKRLTTILVCSETHEKEDSSHALKKANDHEFVQCTQTNFTYNGNF